MGKVNVPKDGLKYKVLVAVTIYLSLIIIGSIIINLTSHSKFSDSFYEASRIITGADTKGMSDFIKPALVVLAVSGGVIQFYFIYIILEYLLEGKFKRNYMEAKHMKKINELKNHYIIAGGGRVGAYVAKELAKYGRSYVILEKDKDRVEELRARNFLVKQANILDEHHLLEANIKDASHVVACLDDDGDNLLLILTAKEINPSLIIASRASSEAIINKLKHAGASYVILPEVIGGIQLAHSLLRHEQMIASQNSQSFSENK